MDLFSFFIYLCCKKVQVGNNQGNANRKEIPTPQTERGKTILTIRYLYLKQKS